MPAPSVASRSAASARSGRTGLAALLLLACACRPEPSQPAAALSPAIERAAAAAPRFLARLEFPTAGGGRAKPVGVLAGDVDGDGRDELVVATRSPGSIQVWRTLTPSIQPAPEPLTLGIGDYPLGPVWADGAGSADGADSKRKRTRIAVASRETLELAVVDLAALLAASPNAFAWRTRLPARPRAIASGDLGRDGTADVAVLTIEDELLVYTGPGEPKRARLPAEHAVATLVASDGERIAVGFQGSRKIAVLRTDGSIEKAVDVRGIPRELAEADLDGDGDTELAAAVGDDSLLVFGLGRAGGPASWLDAAPLETKVGTVPIGLALARPRGKPSSDPARLAVLDLHAQDLRLLDFARGSAATLDVRAAGQRPTDVAVGDFDGDGSVDVAIANGDARRVGILFGEGETSPSGPRFDSETRVACDRAPASIAPGDVDGDGKPDVAVLAAADETLTVLRNEGGRLARRSPGIPAPGASAVACADLDGDGRAEVAYLRKDGSGSSLVVRYPLSEGGFADFSSETLISRRTGIASLLLAGLEGRGTSNAIVTDPEAGLVEITTIRSGLPDRKVGIEPMHGEGVLPRASQVAGACDACVVPGEGGAVLLAVAEGGPGEPRGVGIVRVEKDAQGRAVLGLATQLAMKLYPIRIAAADFDGDGREDLVVLATESMGDSPGFVVPWIAQATGGWKALDAMPTGGRPKSIAVGDIDGDGKADILVASQGSHHIEIWLARGNPVRFERAPDLGAGTGPLDLALVDLDGDGKPEIVVANGFSDDVSVIRMR